MPTHRAKNKRALGLLDVWTQLAVGLRAFQARVGLERASWVACFLGSAGGERWVAYSKGCDWRVPQYAGPGGEGWVATCQALKYVDHGTQDGLPIPVLAGKAGYGTS